MPSFDRLVTVSPPSAANFDADVAALLENAHFLTDTDEPSSVDQTGEFAFVRAANVVPALSATTAPAATETAISIRFRQAPLTTRTGFAQARMAQAAKLVVFPPPAYADLATGADFEGGMAVLATSNRDAAPVDVCAFPLTANARRADGAYIFDVGALDWRAASSSIVYSTNQALERDRLFLSLTFAVAGARIWAMLLESAAIEGGVLGEAVLTRRYMTRQHGGVTVHRELADEDGRWDINGVEPDGRRRYLTVDCQQRSYSTTSVQLNAT